MKCIFSQYGTCKLPTLIYIECNGFSDAERCPFWKKCLGDKDDRTNDN